MLRDRNLVAVMLAVLGWLCCVERVSAQEVEEIRVSAQRGLQFLEADVHKWRQEHDCATCHHGVMTTWAFSEATRRGLGPAPDAASEIITWSKARFMERMDLPRDTRPGWKMVSTPGIYLALIAQFVDGQQAVTADELAIIDRHLLRHQEEDGAWAWSSAPPGNRPPPFFESDEVATRLVLMALEGRDEGHPDQADAIRAGQEQARQWLAKTTREDTTQATAIRLLMDVRLQAPQDSVQKGIRELLERHNVDGGWGQLKDLPSDAYATGQAVYVLRQAGQDAQQPEILGAIQFLLKTQRDDGSWPMTSRAHPGAEPFKNPVPITYFGSAWGTLGLLSVLPEVSDREPR